MNNLDFQFSIVDIRHSLGVRTPRIVDFPSIVEDPSLLVDADEIIAPGFPAILVAAQFPYKIGGIFTNAELEKNPNPTVKDLFHFVYRLYCTAYSDPDYPGACIADIQNLLLEGAKQATPGEFIVEVSS
jgi:hypothetical protein